MQPVLMGHVRLSKTMKTIKIIKTSSKCSKDTKVILIFINIGECIKCNIGIKATIDSVLFKEHDTAVCITAVVPCNRDIELKVFKQNSGWDYGVFRDDGSIKEKLGLPTDTRLAIYDSKNILIGSLTLDDFDPTAYSKMEKIFANPKHDSQ